MNWQNIFVWTTTVAYSGTLIYFGVRRAKSMAEFHEKLMYGTDEEFELLNRRMHALKQKN